MARLVVDRGEGSEDEMIPDLEDVVAARARERKGEAAGRQEVKSGKKKRVLGRRDDNPLLRPLGAVGSERRGVRGGKVAGVVVKERLDVVDETLLDASRVGSSQAEREIPETQQEEDISGRRAPRTTGRMLKKVERRNVTPISDAENLLVPAISSRSKTRTVSRKGVEKTPEMEIQETQQVVPSNSDSEAPVPPTASRLKTSAVRRRRIEKTPEIEIQETQQVVPSISDSEAPVPATKSRFKTRRREKTPELEIQETQQEEDPRTVRPKSKIVAKKDRTPILEIQETQQEENPKSKRLVKKNVILSSDSEDLDLDTTSIFKSKPARGRKRLETPGIDEEEPYFPYKSSRTAGRRAPSKDTNPPARTESEDEDAFFGPLDQESDGMSDFVVNDSEIEESPAPRSVRRLVKGRAPEKEVKSRKMDLEKFLKELNLDDPFDKPGTARKLKETNTRRREPVEEQVDSESTYSKFKPSPQTSTDLDDHFTIKFTPPGTKARKVSKELRFTTPPGSPDPKPKGLQSPKKLQRIPSTPHGPAVDDFWSQDVVNDWNDEYSPRKTPKPPPKSSFSKNNTISEGDLFSPKKSPVKQDRIAKNAKKEFAERKHLLAESFLIELDTVITTGQISKLAASTGGVKLIWSKKLNTTAGRANWKRETIRSSTLVGPDGKPLITYRHHASIELAEKVIDDEDRLLNVIAHEFCHLANFMISNIKTNPHGKEFKAWASQVSRHFKDRGIEVTTKHSYTIDYKYIWECENCGLEFKRHSKSIDPTRHRCGSCKAKLVQTKPVPRKGMVVSEYQVFVKENMKLVMKENPKSPQKEILGLVGKRYQEFKAERAAGTKSESVDIREVDVTSKESTPGQEEEEDGLDFVARKLDFLDLTSP